MTGSSQPQYVQQSSTTNAPAWLQPIQQDVAGQAQSLYQNFHPSYYPGATYVPENPLTQSGVNQIANIAQQGSPLIPGAQDQAQKTLSGQYLNAGNPEFGNMVNQIAQSTKAALDPSFASTNRMGSGAYANALSDAVTRQAGQLAYQNYGQERQNQLNVMSQAPQLAQASYIDPTMLMQAGQTQEGYAGQQMQDAINRWNYQQTQPWQTLSQYAAVAGMPGQVGSQTTQSIPTFSNGLATGFGGAAAGASILGSLFGRGGILR